MSPLNTTRGADTGERHMSQLNTTRGADTEGGS
jgi:hypothetical protein